MKILGHYNVKGIKLSKDFSITHLFFIDDVLIFGIDSLDEWMSYKEIINLFYKASEMSVSLRKSSFFQPNLEKYTLDCITSILPFKKCKHEDGFNYLGYFLKPNDYRVGDWF